MGDDSVKRPGGWQWAPPGQIPEVDEHAFDTANPEHDISLLLGEDEALVAFVDEDGSAQELERLMAGRSEQQSQEDDDGIRVITINANGVEEESVFDSPEEVHAFLRSRGISQPIIDPDQLPDAPQDSLSQPVSDFLDKTAGVSTLDERTFGSHFHTLRAITGSLEYRHNNLFSDARALREIMTGQPMGDQIAFAPQRFTNAKGVVSAYKALTDYFGDDVARAHKEIAELFEVDFLESRKMDWSELSEEQIYGHPVILSSVMVQDSFRNLRLKNPYLVPHAIFKSVLQAVADDPSADRHDEQMWFGAGLLYATSYEIHMKRILMSDQIEEMGRRDEILADMEREIEHEGIGLRHLLTTATTTAQAAFVIGAYTYLLHACYECADDDAGLEGQIREIYNIALDERHSILVRSSARSILNNIPNQPLDFHEVNTDLMIPLNKYLQRANITNPNALSPDEREQIFAHQKLLVYQRMTILLERIIREMLVDRLELTDTGWTLLDLNADPKNIDEGEARATIRTLLDRIANNSDETAAHYMGAITIKKIDKRVPQLVTSEAFSLAREIRESVNDSNVQEQAVRYNRLSPYFESPGARFNRELHMVRSMALSPQRAHLSFARNVIPNLFRK